MYGWICPKCGGVNAPHMLTCVSCPATVPAPRPAPMPAIPSPWRPTITCNFGQPFGPDVRE